MKKSAVILALALGFSVSQLNATNDTFTSNDFEVVTVTNSEVTPLCKAVALGNLEEVEKLIKKGADINQKSNGMKPIHYAAKFNRVKIIRALLTAGADVHEPCDKGYSPLRHAQITEADDAILFLKRFKKSRA